MNARTYQKAFPRPTRPSPPNTFWKRRQCRSGSNHPTIIEHRDQKPVCPWTCNYTHVLFVSFLGRYEEQMISLQRWNLQCFGWCYPDDKTEGDTVKHYIDTQIRHWKYVPQHFLVEKFTSSAHLVRASLSLSCAPRFFTKTQHVINWNMLRLDVGSAAWSKKPVSRALSSICSSFRRFSAISIFFTLCPHSGWCKPTQTSNGREKGKGSKNR